MRRFAAGPHSIPLGRANQLSLAADRQQGSSMTRIAISGVSGRMGRALVEGCHQGQGMRLGAALDRAGSAAIGSDAGEISGIGRVGVAVGADLGALLGPLGVLVGLSL